MAQQTRLIAGAMSGTSADGVDVAIVRINGTGLAMSAELIQHQHRPYETSLKQAIFALRGDGRVTLSDLARVGREISLAYAACVNDALLAANLKAGDLAAIAAHGQTLYHQPPDTIQWLDPALIAAKTQCAVVSDFRRADCAAGGQGAPLVPFADYILFRHATKNRVLLNIGGIANLTYIPAGAGIDQLIAFDTGPGNCISDWVCRENDPGGCGFDMDGAGASRGAAHLQTAFVGARSDYVFRRPPKSTDGPEMIGVFKATISRAHFDGTVEDQLATACLLSVYTLMMSLDLFLPNWAKGGVDEILISGGGTHNVCLMTMLRQEISLRAPLSLVELESALSHAKEAIAFALLGAATLDGLPSNIPSCTGAKRSVVLGSITPSPK